MAYRLFPSKLYYFALALSLLSTLSTNANAEKMEGETPFILLGSDQTQNNTALKKGASITTTRVAYAIMSEASEDIIGIDGNVVNTTPKTLAARGAQLFGITSGNGRTTYCNVDHKPVGPMEGVFVINSDKHVCFIDANGDGKFESSYDLRTKFSQFVPIYYDVEVTGNSLSSPAGYSPIDPSRCKLPIWLDIYVQKITNKGRTAMIGVQMRTDKGALPFTFTQKINLTEKGETVEILGARFTLSYKDETTLTANLLQGIARQDFSTQRPKVNFQIISI